MKIWTFFNYQLIPENFNFDNNLIILIDIWRASTTITVALHKGTSFIVPVLTRDQALSLKGNYQDPILIGELFGQKYPDFHFNNSPSGIWKEDLTGRVIILCTTNCTQAIHKLKNLGSIFFGSFLNIGALTKYVLKENKDVILICCGKQDFERIALEDIMFCSSFIRAMKEELGHNLWLSEGSYIAYLIDKSPKTIKFLISQSPSAQRIKNNNCEEDLLFVFNENLTSVIPVYLPDKGIIIRK